MFIDKPDVQGLAFSGYARWPHSVFRILRIRDAAAAKVWLAGALETLTFGSFDRKQTAEAPCRRNLAFTAEGLCRLGLPEQALLAFEAPFREGMTTPRRSLFLGDAPGSRNDPQRWLWGAGDDGAAHLLQMLYARTPQDAQALCAAESEATSGFLEEVVPPLAVRLTDDGREHFGFADGLSQPAFEGIGTPTEAGYAGRRLAPGELLLGLPDGLGNPTPGPLVDPDLPGAGGLVQTEGGLSDFGLNGAYLVARQLRQDVGGFNAMTRRLAESAVLKTRLPDHDPAQRAAWAASRIIGRWPSGCPVTASPDRDDPQFAGRNGFMFEETDARGASCPFGAHIRRANPRDSQFEPWRDTSAKEAEKALADNDRRRMLRRGRAFGPLFKEDPAAERGLMFLALGGSIERQFEFVQHSWTLNPNFAGLRDETDPLVGPYPTALTLPGQPVAQRLDGVEPHVWTEGGGYFFLPSRRALRFLAA
jgi:Dyp-type peroxidase family